MRIEHATLAVRGADAAIAFYAGLGLRVARAAGGGSVEVGDARLELVEAPSAGPRPVHHVALRVPRDRLEAAGAWLAAAAPLLVHAGSTTIEWPFWDAAAVYAIDPAGTIVELIAFRGLPASGQTGPFAASELAGIAEVGLPVPDVLAAAAALAPLGVGPWAGRADDGFGALGARGASLIVVPLGRGWFPTGDAAEAPPQRVAFADAAASGQVDVGGCAVSVSSRAGGGAPPPTGGPSARTR